MKNIMIIAVLFIGMMASAQTFDSPVMNEANGTTIVEQGDGTFNVTTTVTTSKALDLLVMSIKGKTNSVISNDTQTLFDIRYSVTGYTVYNENLEELYQSTRVSDVRNFVKDQLKLLK